MASRIDRAANQLGSYLLKGWILTDKTCPNSECKWPLLRSAKDDSYLCGNCDGEIHSKDSFNTPTASSTSSLTISSHLSRPSTPPTEESQRSDSPVFELPPESEASIRRREQSDRASAEIGSRLLKGWAMLAEECPNDDCFGVPLVRPPNSSGPGNKDPRMECVVCARVYTSEVDARGFARLVPLAALQAQGSSQPSPSADHPSAKTFVPAQRNPAPIAPGDLEHPSPASPSPVTSQLYLDPSVKALEATMTTLSKRLIAVQADPLAIGLTADAITKTTQALTAVKHLQWNERQNSLAWP